jgi:pimeloyl-ACP methyl ester carboxylesterase
MTAAERISTADVSKTRPFIGTPTMHVDHDGHQTWVRVHHGTNRAMPPVVLLHGWTLSADEQWHALYPWLAERTSFLALDHPGHGRSDPPRHPFTLSDAANRAAATIRAHLAQPAIVVGFSLGGPVALHIAARFPELVAGLTLVSTSHRFDRSRLMRLELPAIETLTRSRLGDRARQSEARRSSLPSPLNATRPRLHPPTVASAARCLQGIDLSWLCQTVDAPASVVVTSDDRMIPTEHQRELASFLNAPVVELEGGHTMYETNPSAFAVAVAEGISQTMARCDASPNRCRDERSLAPQSLWGPRGQSHR